jgi:hypothetical protein
MKTRLNAPADCLSLLLVLAATNSLAADPRIDSWFTQNSGRYARIYQTAADESSGNATTTWSRGQGTQSLPVYAGVREVSSSAGWVYIRSSGVASYVKGPWYLNAAKTQLFPNYPQTRTCYTASQERPACSLPKPSLASARSVIL